MVYKAILLGISSSTPTKDRNPPSLAIRYNSEVILFDCAEGVQKQLMATKTSYMDIEKIFITHYHADHFLGLPGLLATMSLHERTQDLTIFGPKRIKEKVTALLEIFEINLKYELKFVEIKEGVVFSNDDYLIEAKRVKHSLENYGFVFRERNKVGKFVKEKALALGIPEGPLFSKLKDGKTVEYKGKTFNPEQVMDYTHVKEGKSIGYFVDLYDLGHKDLVKDVDLMFHEATFLSEDKIQAKKTLHSIVSEIAKMFEKAKVKKWILINFSTRYKDLQPLINEAQMHFPNAEIGEELQEYVLRK